MNVVLPLSEMTTAEKMALIETIWEDIEKNSEELEMPAWHAEVLAGVEQRIASGEEEIRDWEDVKKELFAKFQ
ncbi:addiction module protein [Roseimicrobium sp. ORNL1]|uniref:addiction module protein n=1 Tax=Roseimicrobium sp. ORNL1 TaxID=2711231 RepID=UPI0013E12613|nr:addiction module protein [Roseimicrobium sp. ORNL1]QIF01375.1 addiction module protein [Roseimicrobium sp. ORNL1]